MKSRGLIITLVALSVLACALLVCIGVLITRLADTSVANLGDAVAIVYVEGPIVTGQPESEFSSSGVAYSETIIRYLRDAQDNTSVKAIVLRVDSPGGSAVASREIYDEVMRARAKHKPVVASFGEIAASGGYYISAGADKIYAHPATLTGSIGVISVFPSFEGLGEKIGVKFTVIKSGPHKDQGSGYRDLTPEEREIWQTLTNEIYGDFVDVVARGRQLETARVRELADGRVYTGKQAKAVGLVDEVGNLDAAVDAAAKLGKISGTPHRIEFRSEPSLFGTLGFSTLAPWNARTLADLFALGQWGRVMYLYVAP